MDANVWKAYVDFQKGVGALRSKGQRLVVRGSKPPTSTYEALLQAAAGEGECPGGQGIGAALGADEGPLLPPLVLGGGGEGRGAGDRVMPDAAIGLA